MSKKEIDIFALYEDLRKYFGNANDDLFYDAPEGEAQTDIIKEMLTELAELI